MSKAKTLNSSFGKSASKQLSYEGCFGLVYARVSSKKQELEGSGLQSQEGRCIAELSAISVPYERSFLDSFSGGGDFMKRPAMKQLLDYIDAHPHKRYVIIFDDLKRFARDVEFHLKLRAAFQAREVMLRCLNYNFDESPEGRFSEVIMAAQAELERHQNRRQVVQKMKARLEAGYWPFASKKGYNIKKDSSHGKLCFPNEQGLTILKPAMEAFATGMLQRKIDICRFLVEKGFWEKPAKPEKYLDKVHEWLRDPFYSGFIQYDAWDVVRTQGKHEPIISLDTYELIQRRLGKEHLNKRIRIDNSPDFPLRGLTVCADCGGHITGAWSTKKNERYAYYKYQCEKGKCVNYGKSIPVKLIHEEFDLLLQRNKLRDDVDPLVYAVYDRVWIQELNNFKAQEMILEKQKRDLEQKISDLTDLMRTAKNEVLRRTYENQIETTANELEALEEQSIEGVDLKVPYRTALEKSLKLLKNPYSIWEKLDVLEKQKLFYFTFEQKLPFSRTDHYRTTEKSYAVRLFEEFAYQNSSLVDLRRIELLSQQCECRVLPLYDRPTIYSC
jgi:site-specific DNA recombinase